MMVYLNIDRSGRRQALSFLAFSMEQVRKETAEHPVWVLWSRQYFPCFQANVVQELLNAGK